MLRPFRPPPKAGSGDRRNWGAGSSMRELALVLPIHVAAVVWLTWPLAVHLRTHLPDIGFSCGFDLLQMIWALAYQSHTLISAPWRLPEANIYHPAHHAFFYGDAGFGAL